MNAGCLALLSVATAEDQIRRFYYIKEKAISHFEGTCYGYQTVIPPSVGCRVCTAGAGDHWPLALDRLPLVLRIFDPPSVALCCTLSPWLRSRELSEFDQVDRGWGNVDLGADCLPLVLTVLPLGGC